MHQIRMTIDIPDTLYDKIDPASLETDLPRCAEMSFVFLKMFNVISDKHPDVAREAMDGLNRVEDGRLRSFLETFGDA